MEEEEKKRGKRQLTGSSSTLASFVRPVNEVRSKAGPSGTSGVAIGTSYRAPLPLSPGLISPYEQTFPDDADFPDSAFDGSKSPGDRPDEDKVQTQSEHLTSSESEITSDASDMSSSSDCPEVLWSPKKLQASYKYTKLADLQPGLRRINVFGVVKEFTEPRITRGTDFCSILTIIDESNALVGVRCIIFNPHKERLPLIKKEGDIVCLHRVNTTEYRSIMQIDGPPFSGSLRFSSKISRKIKPTTGFVSYTFTATERQRVRELRRWALQRRRTEHVQKLESVREDLKFALLCQVVWVAQFSSANQTILSVWDGTPCPLAIKSAGIDEANIDIDPALATAVGPELQQQIVVDGKLSQKLKVKPGSFIFVSNIEASSHHTGTGEIELRVKGKPQDNVEVISAKEYGHSELRDQLKLALAAQEVVSTTPHGNIPLSSLQEVKDYPLADKPAKFRCRAKLICVLTPSLEETVQLNCEKCGLFKAIPKSVNTEPESGLLTEPCPVCFESTHQHLPESPTPTPHCMFLIRILLADHTTSLEVHIAHDEAVHLFGGLQPTNLFQHQNQRYQLMNKLYQLSGGNPPFSRHSGEKPRPWIDCCLLKVERERKIYYCLFDTALKQN